ncbi:MAG: hypothetical protein ABIS28_15245 [Caldimonas sp.]
MTAEAPRGGFVDTLPEELSPATDAAEEAAPVRSHPNWMASSHDLLNGLEVSDFADTLPNDLYDDLFDG